MTREENMKLHEAIGTRIGEKNAIISKAREELLEAGCTSKASDKFVGIMVNAMSAIEAYREALSIIESLEDDK